MSREYRDSVLRRRRSNKSSSELEVEAIAADIEAAAGGGARPKSRKEVFVSSFQRNRRDRNMDSRKDPQSRE